MGGKRNGEIDAFRFVFAIVIFLFHFGDFLKNSALNNVFKFGNIGVEFFFLVSGYLLAARACRFATRETESFEISSETWRYVAKKFGSFSRYYLTAILLQIVVRYILIRHVRTKAIIYSIIKAIPTLSLSFMALNLNSKSLYIGNTWYLSAMMIAILILYPLMLRDYHFSVKILFPIGTLFLLGYLYGKDGCISNWKEFNGFTYGGILRAVAEMGLGATCFEISKLISSGGIARKTEASALAKLGVTLFKYGCYMVVLCYGHSKLGGISFKTDFDLHALLFCAIAITLSFSGIGYSIPDTRLSRYLAKISLPIYIFHGLFKVCFEEYLGTTDVSLKVAALIIVSSLLISVALMYLIDFAANFIQAKKASG